LIDAAAPGIRLAAPVPSRGKTTLRRLSDGPAAAGVFHTAANDWPSTAQLHTGSRKDSAAADPSVSRSFYASTGKSREAQSRRSEHQPQRL
jgi:hypothetical protein